MHKEIIYKEEARQKILKGVEKLSNAVKLTLGAKGRNVLIKQRYGPPLITNDGVTIAKEVVLKDDFENLGADIVKSVASNTNDNAGDGTTTSVILCHAIFKEGLKYISQGANAMSVKDGIQKATKLVVEYLKENSIKIDTKEQKEQVARISSQDEEIGKIIADMLEEIGDDGIITVEEGNKQKLETEIVQGMQLSSGWQTPHFITDVVSGKAEYKNINVLVTDVKLAFSSDLMPLLNSLVKSGQKELVIFSANDVEGQLLHDLVLNKMKGIMSVLVIKVPGFGERKKDLLEDLAIATSAKYVTSDLGMKLDEVKVEDLGNASKVVADRDKTIVVSGDKTKSQQEVIDLRIKQIKSEIGRNESDFEKEKLQERLARLTNGVGVIKVGAMTEAEQNHRHHRVEDAVEATKAAISEGIVSGGGVAFVEALKSLDIYIENEDERIGFDIVRKALLIPARQIAENAGRDGGEIVAKIKETGLGYDVLTNNFTNMIKSGIIDPVKVTRSALENASSASSILLTTECVITYTDTEQNN